jgi:hypothetical protein
MKIQLFNHKGLFCALAMAALGLAKADAQSQGTLTFDTPGDFNNNFFVFIHAGDNNANNRVVLPTDSGNTQYAESLTGGINGSGAIALNGGGDMTAIYRTRSSDFSTNGAMVTVSVFYKLIAANGGARAIQLGFVNNTNSSMNNNTGSAFMSARPNNQNSLSTSVIFHLQHKTANGGTAGPTMTETLTLTLDHWYKLTVTCKNIKDTAADTFEESGSLDDYGLDGTTLVANVYKIPATQIVNADMTSDNSIWPAFRGFGTGGAAYYDNFSAAIPDASQAPPSIVGLSPDSTTPFNPPADGLQFNATTVAPNSIAPSAIGLTLNGVDVTSGLIITGEATNRSVAYNGLVANMLYYGRITAVDNQGRGTTNNWVFDTFSETNYMIEAEDFNFQGGQYIENPVLSSVESPNNYINKIGLSGIDEFDPTEGGATHAYRAYDAASGIGEKVGTQPIGAAEYTREKYITAQATDPLVQDYDVGWVDVGEWWNYTRTLPIGTFKIYARLSSGNAGTFTARMDRVVAGETTPNQMLVPLGLYTHAGTGDWQQYVFVPLQDIAGNDVILRTDGKATVRFTTLAGGLNANYCVLTPATPPGPLMPYVSVVSPLPNATGVSPEGRINVSITDRDTLVQTNTIKLYLDDTELTSNLEIAATPGGATVSYASPAFLAQGSTHIVRITYSDGATPANQFTNQWSFTVASGLAVIPATLAQPVGSGQTPGFTVRASQQRLDAANTTVRTENQLAGGLLPLVTQGFDTPQVISYWGNGANTNFYHELVPNFPGVDAAVYTENIALEAVAYLALNRGAYRFGATGDDGFRATVGKEAHAIVVDPTNAVVLLDQVGYVAGDRIFSFIVETNGLYPFRLTFEQGAGGYELELYSFDENGARVLINDPSNPNSIKAYRFCSGFPSSMVTFTQQPTNRTVRANLPVTLSTRISAVNGLLTNTYQAYLQWQKAQVDIPGANSPDYTLDFAQVGDSGKYRCKVTLLGYGTVTTAEANLTVTTDTTPPVVTSIIGSNSLTHIIITYSKPVDFATAVATQNYIISPALPVWAAELDASGLVVTLLTSTQQPGNPYTVTINGVTDLVGNKIVDNTQAPFTSYELKVILAANVTGSPYLDVVYDGLVEAASATNTGNYTLTTGTVTNAILSENGRTVILHGSGMTGTNAVTVSGVKDQVGNSVSTRAYPVKTPLWAVNFQLGTAPLPVGYLKDDGSIYGNRGNGLNYGWDVDNIANARYRNNAASPDIRYDTFNHLQKPLPAGRLWQMSIPNGAYTVYAVSGDITATDSTFRIDVQGVLTVNGNAATGRHFIDGTSDVVVTNGMLTVSNNPAGANNKINFIEIFGELVTPVVQPELSIAAITGNVVIRWQTEGTTGYVLEGNTDLSTTNWSLINNPVTPSGTNSTVTVPINPGSQFFRLRK